METPDHLRPFEAQLLPCPFCGGLPRLAWDERQRWTCPRCTVCDASFDDWYISADAVAVWNRRVAETDLASLREELRIVTLERDALLSFGFGVAGAADFLGE